MHVGYFFKVAKVMKVVELVDKGLHGTCGILTLLTTEIQEKKTLYESKKNPCNFFFISYLHGVTHGDEQCTFMEL